MIPEPYKTAILIFATILDVVLFNRHICEKNWGDASIYLGLALFFCYLLAEKIIA